MTMENLDKYYRNYIKINLDNIYDNISVLKENAGENTGLVAVIKTDGYGHGAVPIAKTVADKVEAYAVATIEEAFNLRKHNITKPIYVLGFVHSSQFETMIFEEIRPAIIKYETAKEISDIAKAVGKVAKIHIKIDTGMGRIGFLDNDESADIIKKINDLPNIEIEGIFTHFAASDEKDKTSANNQLERFKVMIGKLKDRNVEIPIKHIYNSAALIDFDEDIFNQARAGIALYGLYPSEDVDKSRAKLKPSLSLYTHIVYIKTVEAGTGISYGSTFVATKETKIATLPIGYGDGYKRNLSNKGYVIIGGKRAPIVGRVCMDQMMVDVTDVDAHEGDLVTLIGKDGNEEITVEELSELAGTFNYEFVCDLGKRIPRVYYRNGEVVCMKDYFDDPYMM